MYFDMGISQLITIGWIGIFLYGSSIHNKNIMLGKNRSRVVEGHGDVQLQLTSSKKLIFKRILYIPGLCRIMLYVARLENKVLM